MYSLLEKTIQSVYREIGVIEEISSVALEYVPDLDETNLDYIFGTKTRIAVPLDSGKKFKVPIERILDGYDIDFQEWVAFKKGDTEKKNPTKIGKALNKAKTTKSKSGEDVSDIEELLKTTDLKSQVNNGDTELYVIYSRSPIDVARMSDEPFESSCHREGSDYFNCALADAQNNAGIAYLITKTEFDNIKDLQAEELIVDYDRGVEGEIKNPLARIRLRKLIDGDGNSQVMPTLRVYSKSGVKYEKVFKDEIIEWSQDKVNPKFNWDETLTLVGGSYEDSSAKDMAKKIFGKDIKYVRSRDEEDVGWRTPDFPDFETFVDDFKMNYELDHPSYGISIDYDIHLNGDNYVAFSADVGNSFNIDLDETKTKMNVYLQGLDGFKDIPEDEEDVIFEFFSDTSSDLERLLDEDYFNIDEDPFEEVSYDVFEVTEDYIGVGVSVKVEEKTIQVEIGDGGDVFFEEGDYGYFRRALIDIENKISGIDNSDTNFNFDDDFVMENFRAYVEDEYGLK